MPASVDEDHGPVADHTIEQLGARPSRTERGLVEPEAHQERTGRVVLRVGCDALEHFGRAQLGREGQGVAEPGRLERVRVSVDEPRQHEPTTDRLMRVTLSMSQLRDLAAALELPEGAYKLLPDDD